MLPIQLQSVQRVLTRLVSVILGITGEILPLTVSLLLSVAVVAAVVEAVAVRMVAPVVDEGLHHPAAGVLGYQVKDSMVASQMLPVLLLGVVVQVVPLSVRLTAPVFQVPSQELQLRMPEEESLPVGKSLLLIPELSEELEARSRRLVVTQSIGSRVRVRIPPEIYERFPGESFHALRYLKNTKYVTDCPRRSFEIRVNKNGHYYVFRDYGGDSLPMLKGTYLTHREAEKTLIKYLTLPENNKFGRAVYPGCPGESPINSTGTSQRG